MQSTNSKLKQPPWLENAEGKTRRVGVELEMSGLDLDTLAELVADFFDLDIVASGRYERLLQGDPAGDWVVELDYDLLKRLGREERLDETLADQLNKSAEDLLAWAAEALVPMEIISPPLPLSRLGDVEALIVLLRKAGAKGTSESAVNAFGMQLNPELPSHDPNTITAFLKAFLCLYDWLFMRADINFSRRATSYVDPFPINYVKKLLAADYWPDLATLIDDYITDNPTRNRALDMLPLFMFLDEKRVRARVDDALIKARPTFHYRLPDCKIDKSDWGLYMAWNDWVDVEHLAADEERLQACCDAYLKFLNSPMKRLFRKWTTRVQKECLLAKKIAGPPVIAITGPERGAFGPRMLVALAVRLYGGHPLQLRPGDEDQHHEYDGVVITGGHDVEPVLYAAEPEIESNYDSARDALEIAIIEEALERELPLLGICRGAQLLNICRGGTLHQELRSRRQKTSNRWTVLPLKTLCIIVEPETRDTQLVALFGEDRSRINSLHNQGIDQVGDGLKVTGRDLDGIIQAVEDPSREFLVGVQWHPEFLLYMKKHRALFHEIVKKARKLKETRGSHLLKAPDNSKYL